MDTFIDQLNDVIRRFGQLTDDVESKRREIDSVSGFSGYRVYGTTMRHSLVGILLQYFSLANGDKSKVKIDTLEWKPYIKISLNGISFQDADRQMKAFENYLTAISDVGEEKLPQVL